MTLMWEIGTDFWTISNKPSESLHIKKKNKENTSKEEHDKETDSDPKKLL